MPAPHSLVNRSLKAAREPHCSSTPAVSLFWASTQAAVSGESGSSSHLQKGPAERPSTSAFAGQTRGLR